MKTCTNCHNKIEDDAKFCGKCGNHISLGVDNEQPRIVMPDQSSLISNKIPCPKCGSENIHIGRKGYGGGKALVGTVLLGPIGLLFGQMNANKIIKTCLNCSKKF